MLENPLAPPAHDLVTYADVMRSLVGKATPTARNQLNSLRFLLKHTLWPPSAPTDRRRVIEFFDEHGAAELGVSRASLSVHKSQALAALPRKQRGARSTQSLGGDYRRIYEACPERLVGASRSVIGTFLVYLEDRGIRPDAISSLTLEEYKAHRLLVSPRSAKTIEKTMKTISRIWRALGDNGELAGLALATLPNSDTRDPRQFHVDPQIFSALMTEFEEKIAPWARGERSNSGETFKEAVARLDAMSPEITDKKTAWKERRADKKTSESLKNKSDKWLEAAGFVKRSGQWGAARQKAARDQILACAKAIYLHEGYLIESFDEFCDPDIAAACCEIIARKNGHKGDDSSYIHTILQLHRKIASKYLQLPEDVLERLEAIAEAYPAPMPGIRPKNKAKLRRFTQEKIQAFVNLSNSLIKDANVAIKRARKQAEADLGRKVEVQDLLNETIIRTIMQACAHDIMLARAPRIANFRAISLDWLRRDETKTVITVPAVMIKKRTKGDADLSILLSEEQSERLWTYILRIRPHVLRRDDYENRNLFPCISTKVQAPNRSYDNLLPGLCKVVSRKLGVEIHPHLYRHLIGWIWLKDDPTRLPDVQKMLGHKSLATTLASYAELDESGILQSWNDHIQNMRTKK